MLLRMGARRSLATVAAIVVAVLLAVELAVRFVLAPALPTPIQWGSDETQVKADDLADLAPGGTVFVGSSMMDAGVDPSLFRRHSASDLPSYNASLLGADVRTMRDWTLRAVLPRAAPRTVVIGFSCRELNANEPEQHEQYEEFRDSRAMRRLTGRQTVLDRVDDWFGDRLSLVRHRYELRQPRNLLGRDRRHGQTYTIAGDGMDTYFVDRAYPAPGEIESVLFRGATAFWELDEARLGVLRGLVATLRERSVEPVVVAMPVTEDFVGWMPNGAADDALCREEMSSAVTTAGGTFLDPGVWPRDLFADPIHLNGEGSRRLTTYLADNVSAAP